MKHVGITNAFMAGYAAGYIAALKRERPKQDKRRVAA